MADSPAVHFRAATVRDAVAAVPLIHSSGPAAFDYVFALSGQGLGRALIDELIGRGLRQTCHRMVLDVATSNPRAQALYKRLGFVASGERRSVLANAQGSVPDHRRMERVMGQVPLLSPEGNEGPTSR